MAVTNTAEAVIMPESVTMTAILNRAVLGGQKLYQFRQAIGDQRACLIGQNGSGYILWWS